MISCLYRVLEDSVCSSYLLPYYIPFRLHLSFCNPLLRSSVKFCFAVRHKHSQYYPIGLVS